MHFEDHLEHKCGVRCDTGLFAFGCNEICMTSKARRPGASPVLWSRYTKHDDLQKTLQIPGSAVGCDSAPHEKKRKTFARKTIRRGDFATCGDFLLALRVVRLVVKPAKLDAIIKIKSLNCLPDNIQHGHVWSYRQRQNSEPNQVIHFHLMRNGHRSLGACSTRDLSPTCVPC